MAFKDNQHAGRFALLVVLHLLQQAAAGDGSGKPMEAGRSDSGGNNIDNTSSSRDCQACKSSSGVAGESGSCRNEGCNSSSSSDRSRGVRGLVVAAKLGEATLAVDMGVYSRNR